MSASEFYSQANAAFVDEDYDLALQLFTKAIELDPSSADYYLKRAATNAKLGRNKESADDATASTMLAGGNTDIAGKAYLRKGMALYELGQFVEALNSLEEAKKIGLADRALDTWLSKCKQKVPQTAVSGKGSRVVFA
jgi:suppressor of G2 allele of SKP1